GFAPGRAARPECCSDPRTLCPSCAALALAATTRNELVTNSRRSDTPDDILDIPSSVVFNCACDPDPDSDLLVAPTLGDLLRNERQEATGIHSFDTTPGMGRGTGRHSTEDQYRDAPPVRRSDGKGVVASPDEQE